MLLFLVRHGQSEFNLLGEEAGSDSVITDLGRQQAERVGNWLIERGPFDAMYSSPLQRARQTTEIISRHVAAPVPVILDTLAESEFHLIHTLPQYLHPTAPFNGAGFPPVPPEYDAFRQQIESAINTIVGNALENGHERILVVSHGGTMGTIVRTLVGCHTISVWSMNCGVHCMGWTDNRWEIRFMNRTHFLKDEMEKR